MNLSKQWTKVKAPNLLFNTLVQQKHRVTGEWAAFVNQGELYQDSETSFSLILYSDLRAYRLISELLKRPYNKLLTVNDEVQIKGIPKGLLNAVLQYL